MKLCDIEGCDRPALARGWCRIHYIHWWKYGDPLVGSFRKNDVVERFWAKVDKDGPMCEALNSRCWLWTGGRWQSRGGEWYGQFAADGKKIGAHRFAYQLEYGEIPAAHQVDHRCFVTLCVNTIHLRLVTNKQNQENRSGATARSTSGILGVSWNKARQKWIASVGHNGQQWSRRFDTKEAAAEAVRIKRLELFTHNEADR